MQREGRIVIKGLGTYRGTKENMVKVCKISITHVSTFVSEGFRGTERSLIVMKRDTERRSKLQVNDSQERATGNSEEKLAKT